MPVMTKVMLQILIIQGPEGLLLSEPQLGMRMLDSIEIGERPRLTRREIRGELTGILLTRGGEQQSVELHWQLPDSHALLPLPLPLPGTTLRL